MPARSPVSEAALKAPLTSSTLVSRCASNVRSTTEPVGTGARTAKPCSLPLRSGSTSPTALAAPVDVGAVREEAGRLDHDVDAEVAPAELRGIALGEDDELLAVDDDRVVAGLDRPVVGPQDRVVLQEVGQRLHVGDVVDRDPLDVGVLGLGGAEHIAADASEPVDSHAYGHGVSPLCRT